MESMSQSNIESITSLFKVASFNMCQSCMMRPWVTHQRQAEVNRQHINTLNHIHIKSRPPGSAMDDHPRITVNPSPAMLDDQTDVTLSGLRPNLDVTFAAVLHGTTAKFLSYSHYRADDDGQVKLARDPSTGGSYTGEVTFTFTMLIVVMYTGHS